MKFNDWPPTRNYPAPSINPEFQAELRRIGGYVPGTRLPALKLTWGQDPDTLTRCWGPIRFLRYHCRWHDEKKLGEPEFDDKFVETSPGVFERKRVMLGYKQFYNYGDIIPPNIILQPVVRKTSLGIPRWLFEVATLHSRQDWEKERWTDVNGKPVYGPDGQRIDMQGPYPEGGVTYDMFGLISEHEGTCNCIFKSDLKQPHRGLCCCKQAEESRDCVGRYVQPTWRHLDYARAKWGEFTANRKNTYGLREDEPDLQVTQRARAAQAADLAYNDKLVLVAEEDNFQELIPFSRRLIQGSEGRADKYKFHDFGSPTLTPGDNQAKRKFSKRKGASNATA